MNYDALLSRGQQMQDQLEQNLRDELAKFDMYEVMRKETEKATQLMEFQKTLPFPMYMY